MITWTDIIQGTGDFFLWMFQGMSVLGHIPNAIYGVLIVGGIGYWTYRLKRYKKVAERNSTIE
jgi:hypothetical protein